MSLLIRPLSRQTQPWAIVRQFTPNWFTMTMGTGALALVLGQFPALHRLGEAVWLGNIVLFAVCSGLYAARWLAFPREAALIFGHPVMPMFFGAIPMGLATIVNGLLGFGVARWGVSVVPLAEALWWLDAGLAVACGIAVPFMMFTRQEHRLEAMTAVWLLPVVACEVTAASDGLLVPHLAGAHAVHMLYLGYVLWAMSVPQALGILVLLFLRLVLHKLPPAEMGLTAWLSLGPLGTGALALLLLGEDAPRLLAPVMGEVLRGIGLVGGLCLWGYGAWWLAIALLKTARYAAQGLPFNMGWWGLTFPLAVYTLATLALGRDTGIAAFTGLGEIFAVILTALWGMIMARTLSGAYHGHLFVSPCLASKRS